jgi:hypothetical protein
MDQIQIASGAAVEELSNWVKRRGSANIADNVSRDLATPDDNFDFIRQGIAEQTVWMNH